MPFSLKPHVANMQLITQEEKDVYNDWWEEHFVHFFERVRVEDGVDSIVLDHKDWPRLLTFKYRYRISVKIRDPLAFDNNQELLSQIMIYCKRKKDRIYVIRTDEVPSFRNLKLNIDAIYFKTKADLVEFKLSMPMEIKISTIHRFSWW